MMALDPRLVSSRLSFTEAAALLAGQRLEGVDMGYQLSPHIHHWRRLIVEAVRKGELLGRIVDEHSPPAGGYECFVPEGPYGYVEKSDLPDWLRKLRYAEADILKVFPEHTEAPQDKPGDDDLHPKRETTYQRIIAALLSMQYSPEELKEPYVLANQVLDDCQAQAIKAPASRTTLGELFKQLPPVQKANPD